MKLHAIQTGAVRIKTAQVQGQGHGLRRRLRIFTDQHWTDWLPTYVWVFDHPEGVIVVDTDMPNRWPSWFSPVPLNLAPEAFGPFATSRRLTAAGDVIAVGTPGHTANHLSVLVED